MKRIIFLLMLLPFISSAQTDKADDPLEKHNDGNLVLAQADKTYKQPAVRKANSPRKLKDNEVYTGNVKFKIGETTISCDSAILLTNDDMLLAYHVSLINPESFIFTGDMLSYNKENNIGTLTDNITVTAQNGDVVGTSASYKMDFSYQIYRTLEGSIAAPGKKKN